MKLPSRVSGLAGAILAAASWLSLSPPASAGTVRQLTDLKVTFACPPSLDDAGTVAFTVASTGQLGSNSQHLYRIFRFDAVTGVGHQVTSLDDGVSPAPVPEDLYDDVLPVVAASDDGQWLAFLSPSDPFGSNHDSSMELFVMREDGSQLSQLTDDSAPNSGTVVGLTMAGSANRIAFIGNTDPLGTNTDHRPQIFAIGRDGTGLTQLTQTTGGAFHGLSISDDGLRIVFSYAGDLTGGNPDLSAEIFAVLADGTNLRQLTFSTYPTPRSTAPAISGDGSTVVFESLEDLTGDNPSFYEEIFAINWDGSNLRQLTSTKNIFYPITEAPTITDDGQIVVFHSNHRKGSDNSDGNFEIWRINSDGTGLTSLTSTSTTNGSFQPVISGDGNRVAFYSFYAFTGGNNPDGSLELHSMNISGGQTVQLTEGAFGNNDEPDIASDGSTIVFVADADPMGGEGEVYVVDADTTVVTPVTSLSEGGAAHPTIAGDGTSIVFSADSDPTGGNGDGSEEIFFIRADGTGLVQLTDGSGGRTSKRAVISADGSVVVFESNANQTGQNGDGWPEIFRVFPDGTGLLQLTSAPAGVTSSRPHVNDSGAWVVFESEADLDGGNPDGSWEIWRIQSDGSGLERLTGDPAADSRFPDISGSGDRIAYSSASDPLGTNPDGNLEVFLYEPQTGTRTQITQSAGGSSVDPRISAGGHYAYFLTNALFEEDPDATFHHARADLDSGAIERVGALGGGEPMAAVPDATGARAVFAGRGNFTERNYDWRGELWLIDLDAPAMIRVGGGPAPTLISWNHEAGPLRYDVVRGDVSNLQPGAAEAIDLGDVVCLEDDSPDADTAGFEDPDGPSPGQAFFYVYRGSQGLAVGPGSYGRATDGSERQPAAGDCVP